MTNEAQRNEDMVEPLVRLSSRFTQIHMDRRERAEAVADAHYRTLSPHEWEWTPEQQARMALYCLWAAQRIAAMKAIADGVELAHEPNATLTGGNALQRGEEFYSTCKPEDDLTDPRPELARLRASRLARAESSARGLPSACPAGGCSIPFAERHPASRCVRDLPNTKAEG